MLDGRCGWSPRLAIIVALASLVMLSTAKAFALTGRLTCLEDTAGSPSLGTRHRTMTLRTVCRAGGDPQSGPSSGGMNGERYRNKAVELLGNFLPSGGVVDTIDFSVPKRAGLSLEQMAAELRDGLEKSEWFVTGQVRPELFSDDFVFVDPDVSLKGIENYARGVSRLFDEATARAEVVGCVVNSTQAHTITVTWRLSGRVKVGPGFDIKPYLVFTDFRVDPRTGLVAFQEDRFSLPGWDLLLSALLPPLRPWLAPPAPPADILRTDQSLAGP